jgi:hypothetical protein
MALEQALSVARLGASPSPAPPLLLFASPDAGKSTLLRALTRHGGVPSAPFMHWCCRGRVTA